MKLYHFTKSDTAISFILPTMKLKFHKVKGLNDPIENLRHIFNENTESLILNYDNYQSNTSSILDIQNKYQVISFCSNKLNDCFKNQIMWTHYGESNKGVCLEIDFDKFIAENKKNIDQKNIHHDKIKYDNQSLKVPPSINYGVKKESVPEFARFNEERMNSFSKQVKNYLLYKNSYWQIEDEYRFIIESYMDEYLTIKESLEQIYLGVMFPKENVDNLNLYLEENKIKVMRVDDFTNLQPENI